MISVCYSSDGRYIASGSDDETIRIWDAHTRELVGEPIRASAHFLSFSPHDQLLASGSDDSTPIVQLWDLQATAQAKACFDEPAYGGILSVAFSHKIKQCSSESVDAAHGAESSSVDSQHEGRKLLAAGSSRSELVLIYDLEGDGQVEKLMGHTDWVRSVAFSHDNRYIVSGSDDRTVRVWDVETRAQAKRELMTHTDYVRSVAFSPDDRRIVSGSDDGLVILWDAETGTQVGQSLRGHDGCVFSAAFSPDGRLIASGSVDGTIRIWDAMSGEEIGKLEANDRMVYSVAFSPDGKHILCGSADSKPLIFEVEPYDPSHGTVESV